MSSGRKWSFRIAHIPSAIEKIQNYTAGLDKSTFAKQSMAVDAVIRNFQIIGEAARKIPPNLQAAHPEIPWSEMQGMRHVLIHDYERVDVEIVWATIENDLTPLVEPLRKLLDQADD